MIKKIKFWMGNEWKYETILQYSQVHTRLPYIPATITIDAEYVPPDTPCDVDKIDFYPSGVFVLHKGESIELWIPSRDIDDILVMRNGVWIHMPECPENYMMDLPEGGKMCIVCGAMKKDDNKEKSS